MFEHLNIINLNKVKLPSIITNLNPHSANISNKNVLDFNEKKDISNKMKPYKIYKKRYQSLKYSNPKIITKHKEIRRNKFSFNLKLNNFITKEIKTNSLKFFSPIKKRFYNDQTFLNYNSFEQKFPNNNLSINIDQKKLRNNLLDNNSINNVSKNNLTKYLKKKIPIPILNNIIPNAKKYKNQINIIQSKIYKEISKNNSYDNSMLNNNNNQIKKVQSKKIEKVKIDNNNNKNNSYCFLSYSYNEFDNIPIRKDMEDYHCIKKNLFKNDNNNILFSYFAIFDGHSGKEVSQYLSNNFHQILIKELNNLNQNDNININNIIISIKNTFKLTDKHICKEPSFNKDVGSTGTIILLFELNLSKYIISANIGDSRGYILSKNILIQITKDHKCNDKNEVSRIKNSGGIVFNQRVFGTLMLTRSFGDKEMKNYGVIAEPYTFCHKINEEDKYVIIASDGIWDVISENDIINMGKDMLSSDEFSKKIVKLAIDKGSTDNISCILIKLNS